MIRKLLQCNVSLVLIKQSAVFLKGYFQKLGLVLNQVIHIFIAFNQLFVITTEKQSIELANYLVKFLEI